MSTATVLNPHATDEKIWSFISKRRCRVGNKTKPGIYGNTLARAELVVADEFGIPLHEVRRLLNQLEKRTGKKVRYSANRLYAWIPRRDVRSSGETNDRDEMSRDRYKKRRRGCGRPPSRKEKAKAARRGQFTTRDDAPLPSGWGEFRGAKPYDAGLLRACALR